MSPYITNTLINAPLAAAYCGLGAVTSGVVFNKLIDLLEYALIKSGADYEKAQKTFDGIVIVQMPIKKSFCYAQNIVLAALVAAVSLKAVQVLALAGCPAAIATPLLVGSVAAPIFLALYNMILYNLGPRVNTVRSVAISDEECTMRGINKESIKTLQLACSVYLHFGAAPTIAYEYDGDLNNMD